MSLTHPQDGCANVKECVCSMNACGTYITAAQYKFNINSVSFVPTFSWLLHDQFSYTVCVIPVIFGMYLQVLPWKEMFL